MKEGYGLRACGPCLCGEHGAAAPCPGVTGPWGHLAVKKLEAVLYLAAGIMWLYLMCHGTTILVSDSLAHRMDQERLWLGLPLAMVPEDTLPSEKTVLRALLHGLFENNMKKYREQSERISCNLFKENSKARCVVEKGCSETPSPCLLYQVIETALFVSFSNVVT